MKIATYKCRNKKNGYGFRLEMRNDNGLMFFRTGFKTSGQAKKAAICMQEGYISGFSDAHNDWKFSLQKEFKPNIIKRKTWWQEKKDIAMANLRRLGLVGGGE